MLKIRTELRSMCCCVTNNGLQEAGKLIPLTCIHVGDAVRKLTTSCLSSALMPETSYLVTVCQSLQLWYLLPTDV